MKQQPLFADRIKALKHPIRTSSKMNKYFSAQHIFYDFQSYTLQKQNEEPESPVFADKNLNNIQFRQISNHKDRYNTTDVFQQNDKRDNQQKKSLNIGLTIDNILERIQQLKSQFKPTKHGSQKYLINASCVPVTPLKLKNKKYSQETTGKFEKIEICQKFQKNQKIARPKNFSIYEYQKQMEVFPKLQNPLKIRQKVQSLYNVFSTLDSQNLVSPEFCTLTMSAFQLGKKIGEGKYGDVFICRHKNTKSIYALKKIMKSTIKQYSMIDQFTNQLKIHYLLLHPNVIKLYAHFQDEYHVFLLMEYAQGGSLIKYLKKTENFVSEVIQQVLLALKFMHQKNISHRDLKPQNIVVFFNNSIKICDFGWSKLFNNEMKISRTLCGTPDYISPQMKDQGIYSVSVDLWSIGVLCFQLLAGYPPFQKQIKQWIKNGTKKSFKWNWSNVVYPLIIKEQAKNFIQSLLRQNPQQRMTIDQCINHAFIQKNKTKIKGLQA